MINIKNFNFDKIINFLLGVFLILLPSQIYLTGYISPIFPALEIAVIYYFLTTNSYNILIVIILGIFIDKLQNLPVGINSIAFISGWYVLQVTGKSFNYKQYYINLINFMPFLLVVILIRYILVWINYDYGLNIIEIIFLFLTTSCSYPSVNHVFTRKIIVN